MNIHIAPLIAIVRPVNIKDITYDLEVSYILPANGGPTAVAIPWNIINIPKEFVIFSSPNKSTNNRDVIETYPPLLFNCVQIYFI